MLQEEIKVAAGGKGGTTGGVHLLSFLAKAVVDVVRNNLNKNQTARSFCRLIEMETLARPSWQNVEGKSLIWETS